MSEPTRNGNGLDGELGLPGIATRAAPERLRDQGHAPNLRVVAYLSERSLRQLAHLLVCLQGRGAHGTTAAREGTRPRLGGGREAARAASPTLPG